MGWIFPISFPHLTVAITVLPISYTVSILRSEEAPGILSILPHMVWNRRPGDLALINPRMDGD